MYMRMLKILSVTLVRNILPAKEVSKFILKEFTKREEIINVVFVIKLLKNSVEQRFVQILHLFLLLAHGPGYDTGTSADDGQVNPPDAGVVVD